VSAPTDTAGDVDVGARGFLRFFGAAARKKYLLLVRYPVNTISQFGTILLVFFVLFFGGRAVAPTAIADTIEGIIVGYLLWSMSITAYSGLSWGVTREAQWGTLEQLFMSPFGFGPVMVVKTVVNVLESFLWGAGTLLVMMAVTGRWLSVDPLTVLPISAVSPSGSSESRTPSSLCSSCSSGSSPRPSPTTRC
jgi:ABC-2 type transport system permease protein